MAKGIMMFTGPTGVHAGDVEGTLDFTRIAVTYTYTISGQSYRGSYEGALQEGGKYTGAWQEEEVGKGVAFSGEATLARLVEGRQCILYGTWKQTSPTGDDAGRWTLDLELT